MKLNKRLTRANFWDAIKLEFPKATNLFCKWVDEYNKEVKWISLFNCDILGFSFMPKFQDIPYEFQQGIWIEFATQTLNNYFEQPEYIYFGDLEEDIKRVFSEIEALIIEE